MIRIIDTSVAVKWFVEETQQDRALDILNNILDDPESFAVPELFFFELNHVLFKVIGNVSVEHQILLDQLLTIGIQRFSMTSEWRKEIERFQKLGLSGYDSAFVGLAKILQGRWLTCDEKAHKKIKQFNLSELL